MHEITVKFLQSVEVFLSHKLSTSFGDNEFIFHFDIVPPYTAKSTKEWLKEKRLPVFDWSANSPDVNPIKIFGEFRRNYYPLNLKELKRVLTEV